MRLCLVLIVLLCVAGCKPTPTPTATAAPPTSTPVPPTATFQITALSIDPQKVVVGVDAFLMVTFSQPQPSDTVFTVQSSDSTGIVTPNGTLPAGATSVSIPIHPLTQGNFVLTVTVALDGTRDSKDIHVTIEAL